MQKRSRPFQVVHGSQGLKVPPPGAVVTIGNFDGVHLGHRHILQTLAERAREVGGSACLLTFDPPPSRVVGRRKAVPQITTLEDRQWLVDDAGVDVMVIEPFTPELAAWSPERFVSEILHGRFDPVEVWVGYDFAFGRDRAGDVHFLEAWFKEHGVTVRQLHAVTGDGGDIISSTRVRELMTQGDVGAAAALLGRPHFVRGPVVQGDRRGRTIGFPTANVASVTELLPANGVYATWLSVDGVAWPSVTNVGQRPTFQGEGVRVETHVFDFDSDLYGRDVAVWFHSRLRGEQRFDGIDALVQQIREDAAEARHRLAPAAIPRLAAASSLPLGARP